jgi:uncharacterized membrane protein YqjE
MPTASVSLKQLAATLRQFARTLLTVGENRLELLTLEMQEERERLLHAFLLALGVATFGLLAGVAFTGALVVLLWAVSPAGVLLVLTVLYAAAAFYLFRRLTGLMRDWRTLSATLDQLRKDRVCLEGILT